MFCASQKYQHFFEKFYVHPGANCPRNSKMVLILGEAVFELLITTKFVHLINNSRTAWSTEISKIFLNFLIYFKDVSRFKTVLVIFKQRTKHA